VSGSPPTAAGSLESWLAYLETLHPKSIEMGLERVRRVASRLDLALECPVLTVTGTNGKGSVCAYLDAILRAAHYRTGLYTSPHLLAYNERVQVDGVAATDADLVAAFGEVERVREDVPLTYFEFGTLAALRLFARAKLEALVLEVGLGGRLDAVNIVDADVAVVTGIALDHAEYLGGTRESVAREKAGIMRPGRPAICADPDPPAPLLEHAAAIGARLSRLGTDFGYRAGQGQWDYWQRRPEGDDGPAPPAVHWRHGLPTPALRGRVQLRNASAALAALEELRDRLPVTMGAVRDGLAGVSLPARFQVLPGRPAIVLDVAHNPEAAATLGANLADMGYFPATFSVFSILGDKDIGGVGAALRARIDRWLVAPSPGPRGASAATIRERLVAAGVAESAVEEAADVPSALAAAQGKAGDADRIVIFGSFVTVAAALRALADSRGG
jgi:dihydrofolate synthase/folylpolyglutamate synthase